MSTIFCGHARQQRIVLIDHRVYGRGTWARVTLRCLGWFKNSKSSKLRAGTLDANSPFFTPILIGMHRNAAFRFNGRRAESCSEAIT